MKVLAYTSPARGHLFPTVPIVLELRRRGHDVAVRTMAAEVPRLQAMGLPAASISAQIEAVEHDDYLAGNPIAAINRAIRVMARRAAYEVPDVQSAIAAESPDLLLMDTNCWGGTAVAEAWGGPWALLQHFLTPLPAPDVPPFGPGLKPREDALGRLRNRVLRPVIAGGFERRLLPPLNEIRRGLGVAPTRDLADLYTRAPLTLYLTSESFEYPRRSWPETFCLTGPIVWDPPADPPDWLATVDRPVALVTTSSEFQNDGEIVRACLDGLADEDLHVVATAPSGDPHVDLARNANAHAHVERWVPHSLVLPMAAVAITHGGMGATQKALAAGVPLVVVPWGRDQLEVGRRVERAGVGVLLPRKKLAPATVRAAVTRARGLTPAAQRFAADLAHEGGATLAADRLELLENNYGM